MGPVIASGNASGNGRETLNKPHRQSSISIEPGNSGFSMADGRVEVSVILLMPSLRLPAAVLGNQIFQVINCRIVGTP